ncbi:MAG: MFS transporter [Gemmatimonadales bacterium]|nr:MAG: MFS transporter [Gemmatimonadales bacterium]
MGGAGSTGHHHGVVHAGHPSPVLPHPTHDAGAPRGAGPEPGAGPGPDTPPLRGEPPVSRRVRDGLAPRPRPGGLRPPTRSSPRLVVLILWLLVFSASSQVMLIAPILPLVGDELGIREGLLGTLVSAYSIMVGIFAVVSGPFSDRLGRRRILLMGAGIMTGALALHLLVTGYWSFMAVRVVAGVGGGVLSGAAVSFVGDYFSYERRGWATGWVMSGTAFGQILGIPAGVVLAGAFGFRIPFLMFAITMGATFALMLLRLPQPDVQRSEHPVTLRRAASDYLDMLRRPEISWASCAFFLMFLGVSLYVVYLPTWLEREVGATPNQIALLFLVGGVANVLVAPQAGRLSDRVGRKGIILTSAVGLAICMALTTLVVRDVWMAFPWFFLVMALVAMRIGPFSALLTALVRDNRRGSLLSLTVALGQVGFAAGGVLSGILYSSAGYGPLAGLAGASVLAMGLMVWYFVPEPGKDVEVDAGRRISSPTDPSPGPDSSSSEPVPHRAPRAPAGDEPYLVRER